MQIATLEVRLEQFCFKVIQLTKCIRQLSPTINKHSPGRNVGAIGEPQLASVSPDIHISCRHYFIDILGENVVSRNELKFALQRTDH